jgi:cytochrome c-type biogenesis protein CcmF
VLNNILLVVAAATVFLGTFYPLIVEMFGTDKISVGPPYYNRSFVPLMLPLMLVLSVGPVLRWKRDSLGEALRRLRWVAAAVVVVMAGLIAVLGLGRVGAALALGVAAWLVFGALAILVIRTNLFRVPLRRSWMLARNTQQATFGMVFAHAGLGLMVIGITCVTAWAQERIVSLAIGDSTSAGGYEFTLTGVTVGNRENFQFEQGTVAVTRNGAPIEVMQAERRFFPVAGRVTTEAAIAYRGLTNLYVSMGGPDADARWVVRVYYHPLVLLIWIGPLLMSLGGLLSLTDRRFRVGLLGARAPATLAPLT